MRHMRFSRLPQPLGGALLPLDRPVDLVQRGLRLVTLGAQPRRGGQHLLERVQLRGGARKSGAWLLSQQS